MSNNPLNNHQNQLSGFHLQDSEIISSILPPTIYSHDPAASPRTNEQNQKLHEQSKQDEF